MYIIWLMLSYKVIKTMDYIIQYYHMTFKNWINLDIDNFLNNKTFD